MTLQLPPSRTLPEPDRMLEAILTTPAPSQSVANRRWSGPILVAAVLVLIALAVIAFRPPPSEVAEPVATPTAPSSVRSTPAAGPGPTSPPTGGPTLRPGATAHFDDVDVTVVDVRTGEHGGTFVNAEVCLRNAPEQTSQLGWDAWTITGSSRAVGPDARAVSEALRPVYPPQSSLAVGDCARGWVPFSVNRNSISYRDRSGRTATWETFAHSRPYQAHLGDTQRRNNGTTYRAVSALRSGGVYAVYVKICLPKGHGPVALSTDDWTLATSAGTVTTADPITDAPPLPSTFRSGSYRGGECATGYVPFGVDPSATVESIAYRVSVLRWQSTFDWL